MKKSIFIFLFLLTACSSFKRSEPHLYSFSQIKNLFGPLTQEEVVKKLGAPSRISKFGSQENWIYNDPSNESKVLELKFNESKRIEQLSWMPTQQNNDSQLESIFSYYPKETFKSVSNRLTSADGVDNETTYSNNSSISLLYNNARKEVEAVIWYTPKISVNLDSKNSM